VFRLGARAAAVTPGGGIDANHIDGVRPAPNCIDVPNVGWKGRRLSSAKWRLHTWLIEGSQAPQSLVVDFQLGSDPMAK
jgi:hypothetical protein